MGDSQHIAGKKGTFVIIVSEQGQKLWKIKSVGNKLINFLIILAKNEGTNRNRTGGMGTLSPWDGLAHGSIS